MLTLFSVGLPLLAVALLGVLYVPFRWLLHRFPGIESAMLRAAAFDVFRLL